MGFWDFDWLFGEPERISGTPSVPSRGLYGRGQRRGPVNPWNRATGAARNFQDKYNDRGDGLGGGTFTPGPNSIGNYRQARNDRFAQKVRDEISIANTVTADDILAQLEAMQDPSRYLQDPGSLARQAMEMASAQYDPLIAQLEAAMGGAQSRADRNKVELGNMFSALSTNLQGDIPKIQQQYATDKAEAQQTFDQLQGNIAGQYDKSAAEQEAMLKRLNIEAAAPDILPQQQADRDYFTQLAARDATVERQALDREERGAVDFTQQGSQIARTEGTQRQADLMSQLAEVMNQYQSQIGAQKAAKQSTYMANLLGLQGDQQSNAMESAQRDFENYMKMIQLSRDLKKDEAGKPIGSVKSPADVAGRALGMGLPQNSSQKVQDVFMNAIGSDAQILSGMSVFGQSVPKEALAQRIVEAGRKRGLSNAELNALQTIALEYFGRR